MAYLPYLVAAWLLIVGLYGIITSRHLVHLIMCLVVVQTSTYVLLLAIGFRNGATAPVFADVPVGTPAVDPVVQARERERVLATSPPVLSGIPAKWVPHGSSGMLPAPIELTNARTIHSQPAPPVRASRGC